MATYTVDTREDVVDPADGLTSFREAVALAAANPGRDEIRFDPGLKPGPGREVRVSLSQGEVEIVDAGGLLIDGDVDGDGVADVVLRGSGSATPNQRVLVVTGGEVDMRHLVLSGGVARYGSGAASYGGNLFIGAGAEVTFAEGRIERGFAAAGGGIENQGSLVMANASITDNSSDGLGGGLSNFGAARLTNVTIADNDAGGSGGGVYSGLYATAVLTLRQSTVTGNSAGDGGGVLSGAAGTTTIADSIVLGNSGGSGDLDSLGGEVLEGVVLANGIVLDGSGDGTPVTAAEVFRDLGPGGGGAVLLQGGSARVAALRGGSAAVDAVASVTATDALDLDGDGDTAEPVPVDATGARRDFGGFADLGAVEAGRIVVTTLEDEAFGGHSFAEEAADGSGLSLREALALAEAGDTIAFAPNGALAGTRFSSFGTPEIRLTQGELTVDRFVRLEGAVEGGGSIVIDGGNASRLFDVESSAVLRDLVLTGGSTSDFGGAVRTAEGTTVTLADVSVSGSIAGVGGGAVHAAGTLFLSNALVTTSTAGLQGGALNVAPTGDARLHNVTLYGNAAPSGGAIFVDGDGSGAGGALRLSSATLTGNVTSGGGGAVERDLNGGAGSPVILNSIILGNEGGNANPFNLSSSYLGETITDSRSPGGGLGAAPVDVFASVTGPGGGSFTTVEGAGVLSPNLFCRQSVELRRRGAAIDVGDASLLPVTNSGPTATDGRGAPRLVDFDGDGAALDLGAAELQVVDQPIEVQGETEIRLPEGQPFGVFTGGPLSLIEPDAGDPQPVIIGAAEGAFGRFEIRDGNLTYTRNPGRPDLPAGRTETDEAVFTPFDPVASAPVPEAAFTVRAVILGVNAADGGDNLMLGDGGADRFDGEEGNDTLGGRGGDDSLIGRAGEDVLRGARGDDRLFGGLDDDQLRGGPGADTMVGGGGSDFAVGAGGGDLIRGGPGDDVLSGSAGDDRLFGNAGADALFGGGRADVLRGGRGRDDLVGGGGRDVFVVARRDGADTIADFRDGIDTIRILSGSESFADLVIVQRGADALVRHGGRGDRLLLEDVNAAALGFDDFAFG